MALKDKNKIVNVVYNFQKEISRECLHEMYVQRLRGYQITFLLFQGCTRDTYNIISILHLIPDNKT
jgi:hypothetical protein